MLMPLQTLLMKIAHINWRIDDPHLNRQIFYEIFYIFCVFAEIRLLCRIFALFQPEDETISFHGSLLIIQRVFLLHQIGTKDIILIGISDPCFQKLFGIRVVTKIINRAKFGTNRLLNIHIFNILIPIFDQLAITYLNIFRQFFLYFFINRTTFMIKRSKKFGLSQIKINGLNRSQVQIVFKLLDLLVLWTLYLSELHWNKPQRYGPK